MAWFTKKGDVLTPERVLPGRSHAIVDPGIHRVLGTRIGPPFPPGHQRAVFAMGCFWGAERLFWQLAGVHTTAVGYSGGSTPNPTYQEVCSGLTGHAEAVLVVFDPAMVTYRELLGRFFEGHDPTQGMRQGNDVGTQYRSAIFTEDREQHGEARAIARAYQNELTAAGRATVTTEIEAAGPFYYAEGYHQQYLAANPGGYCGLGGTGVTCPVDVATRGP